MKARNLLSQVVPPTLFLVLCLLAWEGLVRLLGIPSYLVPSPSAILGEAFEERAQLLPAAAVTLAGALGGFLASLTAGVLAAMLFAQARWIRSSLYPWAIFLQTVPIVAIAPLIVLWFGAGFRSIVLVSFLLSVFPILSNTVDGLTRIDPQLLELFRLHHASRLQTLLKLRLPHSVPFVVAGAKVAAGLTVIGAIVGEFFAGYGASRPGLGYLILQSAGQLKTELLFASVGLSTLLGLLVFLLTSLASRQILSRLDSE
jgi:NitT/TauT family transport system permease protein